MHEVSAPSPRDKPAPSYYHGKCIPRIRGVIKSHGRTAGRVHSPILRWSEGDSSAPLSYCTFVRSFQILPLCFALSLKIFTTLISLSFSFTLPFPSFFLSVINVAALSENMFRILLLSRRPVLRYIFIYYKTM